MTGIGMDRAWQILLRGKRELSSSLLLSFSSSSSLSLPETSDYDYEPEDEQSISSPDCRAKAAKEAKEKAVVNRIIFDRNSPVRFDNPMLAKTVVKTTVHAPCARTTD
jgi:hypothetical protein